MDDQRNKDCVAKEEKAVEKRQRERNPYKMIAGIFSLTIYVIVVRWFNNYGHYYCL